MLTQNEKKQLKALSNKLDIKYQLGKNEISESLIDMLNKALVAHELIKIDVMKGATKPIMALSLDLSSLLHADIVQVVGRVITLYRPNKEKPKIKLKK